MTTSVFVEQLYTKFLGRASDSAGKSYWAEQIDSGSLSASEATQLFLDSPEFADIVSPIAQLYYTALGRIPDAAGLEYWIKDYRSGTSMEAISSAFVQSPEFTSTYGNLADNSEFLEQLYQNTFNRASDQDGKLYWQTAMDAGMSRAKVVNSFANSKEFINAKGNDIKVLLKYHGILGTQPSQNDIDVATAAADPISLITQLYTNDSYTGEAVPGLSTSGVVIDGYVSGATVFIDANGNGIQDSGEASTTTDKFGNFDFAANAGFGNLIMTGGTDISTGKPFEGSMTAPGGSTVVNPLTTLIEKTVQAGTTSVDEAITNVLKSLGLDSSVDLLNFDPIKEAIRTDTDTTKTDIALAIQATAVQVNTLIGQTAALLDGAGVSANEEAAIDSAYSALAASLADTTTTETVDLASSTVIETVIQGAAVAAGADSSQRATVATLSTDATQTISNLNQAIDTAVTGNSDISSTLTKIAAIQIVAEDIEEKMETGAATGDVSDTTTSTDNTVLTNAVDTAGADVGDVTGDGTSDATETTPPPSGGGSSTPSDTTAPADLTSVTIPDSTMKIGSTVTTTITASETGLTLKAGSTIGGFALSNLTDNSNNTYTAQFIVTDGGTDVAAGTDIAVNITLVDAAGNESSAFTTAIAQTSDTIDANTPVISGSNPADDATAVAIGSNIVLTFNEAVAAGTGNIVISDGSDTRTIAVGDAQVTISGNTVTINPTTDLNPNSNYNVQLASGVFTDSAGNAFAGITEATTLDFLTVGVVADGLISGATVFRDTNDNGVLDGGEVSTTTNANGEFSLGGSGTLVAKGGTDTLTGLNFEGFMKAESGGVLNPLTSFLNSSLSATQLLTSMNGFMGLDTSAITDIANFDPTALLTDGDTSNDALGIVTQNIAVQMLNVVDLVANKVAALVGVAAYEARAASIIVDQLSTVLTTTNMANLLGGDGGTAMTSLVSAAGTAIATDLTTLKTANNTTYGDLSSVDITAVQTGFGTASATMISSITAFATSMAGASTASTSSFIEDMVLKQIGAAVEAAGSSDAIAGTFAADTLASSGSGNSVLLGGTGADTITLSATADTVAFLSSQDGGAFGNNTGYDTINNFQTANDKLTICFVYEGSIGGGNHNRTVDVASVNSGALDKNSNDKEIFVLTNTTENNLTDLSAIIAAIGNVTSTDNDQFIVAINNVAGNQAGVYAIDTSGDNNGALLDSTEIAILGIVSTDSALTAGVFTDFGSVVGLS